MDGKTRTSTRARRSEGEDTGRLSLIPRQVRPGLHGLRDPAEIAARGAARLGPRHAARDVRGRLLIDVELESGQYDSALQRAR